jgi:hypothetical protein
MSTKTQVPTIPVEKGWQPLKQPQQSPTDGNQQNGWQPAKTVQTPVKPPPKNP